MGDFENNNYDNSNKNNSYMVDTNKDNDNSYYTYGSNSQEQGEHAYYTPYEEPRKERTSKGIGAKIAAGTAIALMFGLVAGSAFVGTSYFFRTMLESEEVSKAPTDEIAGADLNISKGVTEDSAAEDTKDSAAPDTSERKAGTVISVSGIVDAAMPSIVSLTTMGVTEVRNFFGQTQEFENESRGSGIIISQDKDNLYIATNNHVVTGADTLTVTFDDNTTVSAAVKGTDAATDLAVVSVSKDSLEADTLKAIRTATFGDSKSLKVGEAAVAIGNALGYGQSVTTGVISATMREITVVDETTGKSITNELLQTDAAINPGNSGGALLNLKGEVIGINSVKYSDTSVEGIGYAIPVSSAIPIIQQLITQEEAAASESSYLGISGVDVTTSVAGMYNMPKGVYVASVMEGTAAANAGITQGDIITKFDGREVTSMENVQDIMKYYKAGTTVEVTIQRTVNGKYEESTVNVNLGSKN